MNNLGFRTSSACAGLIFAGLIFTLAIPLGAAYAQTPPATPPSPPPAANPAPPAPEASPTAPPATTPAEKRGDRLDDRASRAEERRSREERRRERTEERRRGAEWRRSLGPFAFAGLCGPRAGEAVDFFLEGIDEIVAPTDAQRAKYDDLKQAAAKAREEAKVGCNAETPITPTGRLESVQTRLDAVLRAVRTLRPALDGFYDALNDEQKAHFNQMMAEPRRRGRFERWRERWLRH